MSEILIGDVRDVLPTLESESVQMCVTSPPYWGLRDYGTATWEGGDAGCDHLGKSFRTKASINANCRTGVDRKNAEGTEPMGQTCSKCNARRIDSQLGLEKTPEEYVENMVAVFREVRRMLKDDGTCWVNMGDSYVSGQGGRQSACGELPPSIRRDRPEPKARPELENAPSGWAERAVTPRTYPGRESGLKPKDLYGMPWRLAFALQADGWYLRQDIIWSKPNPMPESVTDRCTKAHEYLFLLSKAPRYYFDAEAIKETAQDWGPRNRAMNSKGARPEKTGQPAHSFHEGRSECAYSEAGRNKRSVWTVASRPYAEAHFATFPEKLIEPCILAGSRPGDVVLDPFLGSGTTGQVCERLGRDWIGIELNAEYAEMAKRRTAQMGMVI